MHASPFDEWQMVFASREHLRSCDTRCGRSGLTNFIMCCLDSLWFLRDLFTRHEDEMSACDCNRWCRKHVVDLSVITVLQLDQE